MKIFVLFKNLFDTFPDRFIHLQVGGEKKEQHEINQKAMCKMSPKVTLVRYRFQIVKHKISHWKVLGNLFIDEENKESEK